MHTLLDELGRSCGTAATLATDMGMPLPKNGSRDVANAVVEKAVVMV